MCRDQLRDDLISCVAKVVKAVGGFEFIMQSELMFVALAAGPGEAERLRFFTVGACLMQSGPHDATQVFVESSLVGEPIQVGPDSNIVGITRALDGASVEADISSQSCLGDSFSLAAALSGSLATDDIPLFTHDELVADLSSTNPSFVVCQQL